MAESKIQTRIAALLRQAEKASTTEESETYQAKAQELSTRYSIDMEIARALQINSERRPELIKEGFKIGESGKRGLQTYVDLLQAIANQNNVRVTMLQNASYTWLYGYDNDVETTQALYLSLLSQMVHESDAYIRKGEYKTETTYRAVRTRQTDYWGDTYYDTEFKQAPVHGKTARRSFQQAFSRKVSQRLREARLHAEQEAAAGHFHADDTPLEIQAATTAHSVEVAIREKSKEVDLFLKQKEPRLRSFSRRSSDSYSSHASTAGTQAGARARLSAPRALTNA